MVISNDRNKFLMWQKNIQILFQKNDMVVKVYSKYISEEIKI